MSQLQERLQMMAEPQREHRWLQKLVGEWTAEIEAMMAPGQPPVKFSGTESVRSIGGLWVLAEGRSELPRGGSTTSIMLLGYDPQKRRYVGTNIGSMMPYFWVYSGSLDPDERVLTLDTEGPGMTAEGKMTQYKDVIETRSDDHRVLSSHMLGEDGNWHTVMTADFRRKS
ncbi:hypothetical protein ASZ90_009107 [hydrocarbon metagenome]|uniref:DUF1579 domain-containing protein n=1 Tax=hydrocarbon metagenome TaxID=938273 RepID=A0A0W8FJU6_9ZZZZ